MGTNQTGTMGSRLIMSDVKDESHDNAIEAQRAKSGFWFSEDLAPGVKIECILKRILHSSTSPYQKIDVVETYFGKTLVTDGKTQSSQFDEFVYHESLVHPSLLKCALLAGNDKQKGATPRSIFIGGGGELATAREVLRHKSVERLVMVDLDKDVTDVCREHLPEWGGDAIATDPRMELIFGDAHEYLMNTQEKFDVIIMDISDPIEAGPGIALYTKEFYQHALTCLNSPHGVFVTQAGTADPIPHAHTEDHQVDTSCFGPINNTLLEVFDCVFPYSANVPCFGGDWGFVMAFQAPEGTEASDEKTKVALEWRIPPQEVIDGLISDRIQDELGHYDGITHTSMFALTKPLRKSLTRDTRIMTKDNPIFMY